MVRQVTTVDEWTNIEDLVAEWEKDPETRQQVIEARRWVARSFYEPGNPHYERLMRGEGPPRAVPNGEAARD